MSTEMTRAERQDVMKVVRLRARVAIKAVGQRRAELLAQLEDELSARYASNDEAWASVTNAAEEAVAKADKEIAEICKRLGVREEFRPGLHLSWYGRGENGDRERRAELRKLAERRIATAAETAKTKIEQKEAELLTNLVVGGLNSKEAKEALASLPSVEALMPQVTVLELEGSRRAGGD